MDAKKQDSNSRDYWKSLKNKHGRPYGTHAKGHGVKQQHRK